MLFLIEMLPLNEMLGYHGLIVPTGVGQPNDRLTANIPAAEWSRFDSIVQQRTDGDLKPLSLF